MPWARGSGALLHCFTSPAGWARVVSLNATGTQAAVGAGTGDLAIQDLEAGRFTAHLAGHTGRILMIGFLRDAERLVSAAADGTVRLWSIVEQRQRAQIRVDASLNCAAFDPATHQILCASAAGVVALTINDQ